MLQFNKSLCLYAFCKHVLAHNKGVKQMVLDAKGNEQLDYYFDSYSHFGIHEEMLKDEVRTNSYRKAIMFNKHLFQNKVVLDVGCGTGILSMFASKAGARKVYAVDNANIIFQAEQIMKNNGFTNIECIKGKMEEIELPEKVDIIISEWMGYFLLYESMMPTVLYARDKFLNEDGLILPDRCTMEIAMIEDAEYKDEKIDFWDDVYGFDYSCLKPIVLREPLVDTVNANAVSTKSCTMMDINLYTVTAEDLKDINLKFKIHATRNDMAHAFVVWFDTFFQLDKEISFSTSPFAKYTHWKQSILYTKEPMALLKDDVIEGTIHIEPSKKSGRDLLISGKWDWQGAGKARMGDAWSSDYASMTWKMYE
eukprot:NODE_636_length_5161_cov_0.504544.p2 type:complete len:366 gc:universal NODE_636_length_5161_cov_0.504544:2446-3543(+)